MPFNEEALEQAIIEKLNEKGYTYLYGPDIERDYHNVILKEHFINALIRINKGITLEIIEEAYKKIENLGIVKLVEINYEFHKLLVEGCPVSYRENGEIKTYQVKLIDFKNADKNEFLVVNQYTVIERKNKRPDIVVFINGLPVVVFELKSAVNEEATIENAYNQIKNYQIDIPSLFYYNAFNVITDGINAKVGTITSDFTRFMAWKSRNGEAPANDFHSIDVLMDGMFPKERLLDIIRNFIVYQNTSSGTVKILAGYHQYFAVRKAVEKTKESIKRGDRKAGVVWHTQGSGKSLSMVFYTGLIVTSPELENPTVVVLTDRNDLDNQLYSTFASTSTLLLRQSPKQAQSREELKEMLRVNAGGIVFTTIQKFEEGTEVLSERGNIIFIADEAHRSQYGLDAKFDRSTGELKYGLAKHMRDALPNATFIGFTGTPIDMKDKSTIEVFGDYIDIYDMTQAIEDGATLPIYYENRVAKLKLDDDVLKQIDEEYAKLSEDAMERAIERSKKELATLESIIGSKERLDMLADDIIAHYEQRKDILAGKAMIVCMTRKIAIDFYRILLKKRPEWERKVKVILTSSNKDPEEWHEITGTKEYRKQMAIEFKDINSEFKIAIVVDMWLTGFDVPSLTTMYIDKPMKGHNLMQAIARVNRVYKDKEAGLIVDYIGIGNELKQALRQYTARDQNKIPDLSQAYNILCEKLEVMRDFFYGFDYTDFIKGTNNERLSCVLNGVNYILGQSEDDKKLFLKEATALSQAETICRSMVPEDMKIEIEYFKAVKAGICKCIPSGKLTSTEINERIGKILDQAIQQEGIINIFEKAGSKNPEISILSEEYMEQIQKMKHKNIAAELLRKLLEDNIKVFARTSVVKSELFSSKMKKLMNKYNNRLITSAEVIEELLNLSKEMKEAYNAGNALGLTQDEMAFYDALVADPEVLTKMQDETLIKIAHELTEQVKKSRTIDWDKKESARAKMRIMIKRLLRKYDYPPDKVKGAIDIVIKQAEHMSEMMFVY